MAKKLNCAKDNYIRQPTYEMCSKCQTLHACRFLPENCLLLIVRPPQSVKLVKPKSLFHLVKVLITIVSMHL